MRATGIGALLLSCAVASGCQSRSGSMSQIANQARNIGVYAKYPTGLVEIRGYYGRGINGGLNRAESGGDWHASGITREEPPEFFIVNLPDARIADSKVYWFDDAEALERAQNAWGVDPPRSLLTDIEDVGSKIYRVSAPELRQKAAERRQKATTNDIGNAVLVVRMPAEAQSGVGVGTDRGIYVDLIGRRPPDDRMYRVSLADRASPDE